MSNAADSQQPVLILSWMDGSQVNTQLSFTSFWVFCRWLQREQTDRVLAPQTVAFHEPGSGHGEGASRRVHVTTVATHHPEAEDGPSGEQTRGTWPLSTLLTITILIEHLLQTNNSDTCL